MTQVVVLLRGVNVGGHHRVPMAAFRELLGSLGLHDVRTLLNSGNAVAHAPERVRAWERLATMIRSTLAAELQVDVPVVVTPASAFDTIVAENTLSSPTLDPSRLLVAFAQAATTLPPLTSIAALLAGDEQFLLGTHAAYLHCAHGIRDSKAAAALLGRIGRDVTTRNWATVGKLHALLAAGHA